jgi:hypothetical protein
MSRCQEEESAGYFPPATTIPAGLKSRGGRGARVAAQVVAAIAAGSCGALAAETDTNSFDEGEGRFWREMNRESW